ncbi:MAG: flagellar biosynthesis protein FliC [Bacteroidetes bacterium]|nr:flagellar biosynthesis protein FliC [Bacteroidota bacterium]MBU1115177.1 flagellar biosynthesis protein FliC [Bacteroidota bacterium]MBU1799348.1 flagellar biosynthesis protein FliC [Bacteroidota bacterium]
MGFQINTNIGALKAYNALSSLNAKTQKAQLRLATQKRINSVADDTSGFNVGKSLDQKVKLMQSAQGNVGSAKDMLATAESQLISIKDMLTQIKSKVADASNPAADKASIVNDIKAIGEEIASAMETTKFNDTSLLVSAGGSAPSFSFQTGAASTDTLTVNYATSTGGGDLAGTTSMTTAGSNVVAGVSDIVNNALGTDAGAGIGIAELTTSNISDLLTNIDLFETEVDDSLGAIGNFVQRLDAKDDFLTSAIANSQASVSRLFDADMATEQLNATKSSIGGQAATAMLAQLNFAPQAVLQLLG